jgi:TRAP-type C4-dicarboxylate transport system substrate-binding protein
MRNSMRSAVVLGLWFCASSSLSAYAGPSAPKVQTIRWYVAHDRGDTPFTKIIRDFARGLEEKSSGALKVEFIDSSGVPQTGLDDAAYKQILDGGADMAQIPARSAGVGVFEMPFLFRSYDHAELIFNGPIGKKLLADVGAGSKQKVRGVAFTYSGGYRILVGRAPVRRASDLKNLRMRKGSGLEDLMTEWGVRQVDSDPAFRGPPVAQIGAGLIDLEETEINRLAIILKEHPDALKKVEFANLTRHRMYVTAIVANEKFLAALPAAHRRLLLGEIEALAVAERRLSIGLEKSNLDLLVKGGLNVVELPAAERAAFIKTGESSHKNNPDMAGLIKEIQEVKALSGT